MSEQTKRLLHRALEREHALSHELADAQTINVNLTADFHRVQSELDAAEQDRDAALAETERLKRDLDGIKKYWGWYLDREKKR